MRLHSTVSTLRPWCSEKTKRKQRIMYSNFECMNKNWESPFIFLLFPFRFVQQLKFIYLNKSNFVCFSERNNKAHTTWICAIHIVFINSMSIDQMIFFLNKTLFPVKVSIWKFSFENSIITRAKSKISNKKS